MLYTSAKLKPEKLSTRSITPKAKFDEPLNTVVLLNSLSVVTQYVSSFYSCRTKQGTHYSRTAQSTAKSIDSEQTTY